MIKLLNKKKLLNNIKKQIADDIKVKTKAVTEDIEEELYKAYAETVDGRKFNYTPLNNPANFSSPNPARNAYFKNAFTERYALFSKARANVTSEKTVNIANNVVTIRIHSRMENGNGDLHNIWYFEDLGTDDFTQNNRSPFLKSFSYNPEGVTVKGIEGKGYSQNILEEVLRNMRTRLGFFRIVHTDLPTKESLEWTDDPILKKLPKFGG